MKIIEYSSVYSEPICLALGFFDCLHIGHKSVIDQTKEMSESLNTQAVVWTFTDNLKSFKGENTKIVFSLSERIKRLENLGISAIIINDFDDDFKGLKPVEFLNKLKNNFNLKGIVAGFDYRFGNGRMGDIKVLQEFCSSNGIKFKAVKLLDFNNEKCSTTYAKKLIENGEIETLNKMLSEDYSVTGIVEHGNEVGRQIGFPTINISVDDSKIQLKKGVYSSYVEIDSKRFKCITNVGARPTFSDDCNKIETNIIGFEGNLYDKEIEVHFKRYLRDITKYNQVGELIQQLEKDKKAVLND